MRKGLLFVSTLGLILTLTSCGGSVFSSEITTIDELYAMESNKSYVLKNDIDLGSRQWYPLSVQNFDGNGHTIKNGYFIDDCQYDNNYQTYTSGFFRYSTGIKNLTLENIDCTVNSTVTSKYDYNAVGVLSGTVKGEVTNCLIRQCNLTANFTSAEKSSMYSAVKGQYGVGGLVGYGSTTNNCRVEDSMINMKITHDGYADVCLGGISGFNFECGNNNRVVDSKIIGNVKVEKSTVGEILVGGIFGNVLRVSNKLENSLFMNNEVSMESTVGIIKTGGIIGAFQDSYINNCIVKDNKFTIKAYESYNVGGIVGNFRETSSNTNHRLENCLSINNEFECSVSNKSNEKTRVGGITGYINSPVYYSVSKDNLVKGSTLVKKEDYSSGFIASSSTVFNSISINNDVSGYSIDTFAFPDSLISNSYIVDNRNLNNSNNVEQADLENNDLITLLSLSKDYWENKEDINLKLNNEI